MGLDGPIADVVLQLFCFSWLTRNPADPLTGIVLCRPHIFWIQVSTLDWNFLSRAEEEFVEHALGALLKAKWI